MRKLLSAVAVIVVSACASAPKNAEQPGLVIPPPPPHVVPITPEPVIEPVGEIPAPPSSGAPPARSGRGTRETPPKPQTLETKPDAKPETPAELPATASPPATTPAGPPPQLRTAESAGTEATVRATIDRTRSMLSTVDYRRLTSARKKAYDDAKAFAQQAEDALKAGNVVFAQGVAGKAETLAKDLSGR